ncbi:LPXTG cell wall anchor domain-containing protein [Lacticaseibacillus camelliae]|uniref:LPXTG cell wall anchor domain-containing protein n=1 Tax=Lacticaseibacillus camelliae TaxID=381742 RepID=UPI00138F5D07
MANASGTTNTAKGKTLPKTGDKVSPLGAAGLLISAMSALLAVGTERKRRRN